MEFFLRKVYPWLIEVSSVSPVLPFIAGLLFMLKRKSSLYKILFSYVILLVLSELVGQIAVRSGSSNTLWKLHVFSPLEFCLLAAVYYNSFKRVVFKRAIVVAAVGFVAFSIANALFIDGITQMNSTAQMVENTLLIMVALLYFYKVANDLKITYLDQDPVFLLSCCLLIYKAGTSMSYAMFNAALAESYDTARMCITIILMLNILYSIGLVIVLKKFTSK